MYFDEEDAKWDTEKRDERWSLGLFIIFRMWK